MTDNFDARRVPVRGAERCPGPFPYYGASGVVDHVDGYLFDGEYLLIAEDGENLRTRNTPVAFIATGKFWVNNHAHIVRGNGLADTRFLMYALEQTDIGGYLSGSTMPKLTQGSLNRITLEMPERSEQKAIVRILQSLDDKIALNRRMNETLEAIARAIFRSWFVDFDPVRAKMEGRPPHEMDAEISSLLPADFESIRGRLIPRGWAYSPLLDAVELISGGTPATSNPSYWDGTVPWASAKDISQCGDSFLIATERSITDLGLFNSSTKVIPALSTVVVARGATTGRFTMFGRDIAMNQTCYALCSKEQVGRVLRRLDGRESQPLFE